MQDVCRCCIMDVERCAHECPATRGRGVARVMRVLLVEDEADLARALVAVLAQERYQVAWAGTPEDALDQVSDAEPDLLILDVMFPDDEDGGFHLAASLRSAGLDAPILFLTARDDVDDRVRGLDLGGDDYLAKPFEISELLARVRALLRRDGHARAAVLERGPLRLDFAARSVRWEGSEVDLSDREFALLEMLALNPGRAFAVDELVDRLFPQAASGGYAVRTYVFRLRSKLAPDVVRTIPGGYRLGVP